MAGNIFLIPYTATQPTYQFNTGTTKFTQFYGGSSNVTAIADDDTLWTQGTYEYNGLGFTGATGNRDYLVELTGGTWTKLPTTGNQFGSNYAIRNDGTLWGWGYCVSGGSHHGWYLTTGCTTCGDEIYGRQLTPFNISPELTGITDASHSYNDTMFIASGNLYGYGQNFSYSLGSGATSFGYPTQIGSDSDWESVSVCLGGAGIKTDGKLYTWGNNSYGATAQGVTTGYTTTPTQVGTGTTWAQVAVLGAINSNFFGIAIQTDGSLWSWGRGNAYQTGHGDTDTRTTPEQITGITGAAKVVLGNNNAAVLTTDNKVYSWGYRAAGTGGLTVQYPTQILEGIYVEDIQYNFDDFLYLGIGLIAPSDVAVSNEDCNSMDVSWTNIDTVNVTGNTVQRYTGSTWNDIVTVASGATGTTLSSLTAGQEYILRVQAKGDGTYANSNSATGNTTTPVLFAAASGNTGFTYHSCQCYVGEIDFYSYSGTCVTGDYEFSISGDTAYQTGTTFTGLTAGTYDCWVRDAGNTGFTYNLGNVVVSEYDAIDAGYLLWTGQTCYGVPDGRAIFYDYSGGTGEYEFTVDNGTTWQDSPVFTGLTSAQTCYLRDKNFPCCFDTAHNGPSISKQPLSAGYICCGQKIEGGTAPNQLYVTAPASGYTSVVELEWQSRLYSESGWTTIVGYVDTYYPPITYENTYYRKIIVDDNGDGICTGYSNTISINVSYPDPWCSFDEPYSVSAATCSNRDGEIIVQDAATYNNYYDFYLGDPLGASYIYYTDRFYSTAGWYALVGLPKQQFNDAMGDGCAFTWIQVDDSDTTLTLDNISIRDGSCGTFGATAGRIVYFCSDTGGVGDYDIYVFNEAGDIVSQTNQADISQIIINNLPADNYYLMVLNNDGANGGCRLLVGPTQVKQLTSLAVAGIKKIFVTEWNNLVEYNYWTAEDESYFVSGLDADFFTSIKIKEFVDDTLPTAWFEILMDTKGATYNQTMNKTKQGFIFTDVLTLTIPHADNAKWKTLTDFLTERYVIVFQDNNSEWWVMGYRLGAHVDGYKRANNEFVLEMHALSDNKILTNLSEDYAINNIVNS